MSFPVFNQIKTSDVFEIAVCAGKAILEVYDTKFKIESKGDKSPLTEADKRSHHIIVESLSRLFPGIPVLSEESAAIDYSERKNWDRFWLVDPLDGTKEFIKRNGDFTVNIALIEHQKPVLGVVYVPVEKTGYVGVAGGGAFKVSEDGIHEINPTTNDGNTVRVVASRSHLSPETEDYVKNLTRSGKEVAFLSRGSSLKLCMIAEGSADVYPRFAPTMEWDTAAAQAVVEAVGKKVLAHPDGASLIYNKENLLNPWFIAQ